MILFFSNVEKFNTSAYCDPNKDKIGFECKQNGYQKSFYFPNTKSLPLMLPDVHRALERHVRHNNQLQPFKDRFRDPLKCNHYFFKNYQQGLKRVYPYNLSIEDPYFMKYNLVYDDSALKFKQYFKLK